MLLNTDDKGTDIFDHIRTYYFWRSSRIEIALNLPLSLLLFFKPFAVIFQLLTRACRTILFAFVENFADHLLQYSGVVGSCGIDQGSRHGNWKNKIRGEGWLWPKQHHEEGRSMGRRASVIHYFFRALLLKCVGFRFYTKEQERKRERERDNDDKKE